MLNIVKFKSSKDIEIWTCFEDFDNDPVGFMVIKPYVSDGETLGAQIKYIHVLKEYRGKHVGSFLIDSAKQYFPWLITFRLPDEEMDGFYLKNGFMPLIEEESQIKTMIWHKDYICEQSV